MDVTRDYAKSLKESWKDYAFWNGLSDHDREEIIKVQELYCLHLRTPDVPDAIRYITEKSGFLMFFQRTDHMAASRASSIQYQASTWENRMQGRGKLRTHALDIINEICSYQTIKALRNDSAECMFLEEIKHWATYELALYDLRTDNLDIIAQRVRYLEAILAQDSLFYSTKGSVRTIQKIILETCFQLKYNVIPEIQNEIALKCAREHLSEFRYELKEALQQGIYFLYHVFRDSGRPQSESVTLQRLLSGEGPEMSTSSGRLLYHILTSGAFREAFPEDSRDIVSHLQYNKLDKEDVSIKNEMNTATLYDMEGNLRMPMSLWYAMTVGSTDTKTSFGKVAYTTTTNVVSGSKSIGRRKSLSSSSQTLSPKPLKLYQHQEEDYVILDKEKLCKLFSKKSKSEKTGLEEGFHGQPYVAETFVGAHAMIQELAKFVQIIIKAEKCASGGGDLLVYGYANKQITCLLETYRSLVKKIRRQFEILTRISELRFQQLVNRNRAEPERNFFVPHYRNVHSKFYNFDNQLGRTEKCCEVILNKANSLTLYERFQKLKQDTEDFIVTSNTFALHLNRVLEIPYNPAINQKILITGTNIPNAEKLLSKVTSSVESITGGNDNNKRINGTKREGGMNSDQEDELVLPLVLDFLEKSSATSLCVQSAPPSLVTMVNNQSGGLFQNNNVAANFSNSSGKNSDESSDNEKSPSQTMPRGGGGSNQDRTLAYWNDSTLSGIEQIQFLQKKILTTEIERTRPSKSLTPIPSPIEESPLCYNDHKTHLYFVRRPKMEGESKPIVSIKTMMNPKNVGSCCLNLITQLKKTSFCSLILEKCFSSSDILQTLVSFISAATVMPRIRHLILRKNVKGIDNSSLQELTFLLARPDCNITTLDLSECDLNDSHGDQIVQLIEYNYSIEKLYLSNNRFTDDFVITFRHELTRIGGDPVYRKKPLRLIRIDRTTVMLSKTDSRCRSLVTHSYGKKTLEVLSKSIHIDPKLIIFVTNPNFQSLARAQGEFFSPSVKSNSTLERDLMEYDINCRNRFKKHKEKQAIRRSKLYDQEEKYLQTVRYFEHLIRVCQTYEKCFSSPKVPENFILNAFEGPYYGIPSSFGSESVKRHIAAAINANILNSTTVNKENGGGCRHYQLHVYLSNWDMPMPGSLNFFFIPHDKESDSKIKTRKNLWSYANGAGLVNCIHNKYYAEATKKLRQFYMQNLSFGDTNLQIEDVTGVLDIMILRGILHKTGEGKLTCNNEEICPSYRNLF